MPVGIFVGLSTLDVVHRVDKFPTPNTKITAQSQDVYVGGPATNAAIAFAHLGGSPSLLTAAGRHALADVIRKDAQARSVRLVDLSPDFAEPPSVSSITVDSAGRRNVVSANGGRIEIPQAEADAQLIGKASVMLVDGHFMQACQAWAAAAHARGTPVVLDGGSWKEGAEGLLANVSIAICSADFRPPGCSNEEKTLHYLKQHGVKHVAITHGADPVSFESGSSSGTLRVPEVEAVDTLGAGDIFHGAFCFFVSIGRGFVEALAEAAQIASESCRYRGTREWMKHVSAGELVAESA
ncbi:MAG: PfkB family carbohydrate kinase [Terracidiphilus sp.]